jgi:hypothetical protein
VVLTGLVAADADVLQQSVVEFAEFAQLRVAGDTENVTAEACFEGAAAPSRDRRSRTCDVDSQCGSVYRR